MLCVMIHQKLVTNLTEKSFLDNHFWHNVILQSCLLIFIRIRAKIPVRLER